MPQQDTIEHGPWEKFQTKPVAIAPAPAPAPTEEHGPWEKFQAPKPAAAPPKESGFHTFEKSLATSFGFDPDKLLQAYQGKDIEGLLGKKRHLTGTLAQLAEAGEQFGENIHKAGVSLFKDPFKISEIAEAPARGLEAGVQQIRKGKTAEGAGTALGNLAQIFAGAEGIDKLKAHSSTVDGGIRAAAELAQKQGHDVGEAASTAAKFQEGMPSRILKRRVFEDAYIHAKGLDIAKKVNKAAKAIDEEVKTHSSGIASQIDTKIPAGVIDAAGEAATIVKEFQDAVKTPERYHPALGQMLADAKKTAPKMWTWEKVRQFRSSVGRAMGKAEGPQNQVLTRIYRDLTKKLGDTAKQYGLETSWKHYNELERKTSHQFRDLIDYVRDAQSGQEVAQKLTKDKSLTAETARNLSKYGLDSKEVLKFTSDAARILRQKGFWNTTLFRLAYGSPVGAPVMIALRMAGAPWMAGLGAGALVGLGSSYLVNMARAMRLSPEIIEQIMKERELPGKMDVPTGKFPTEGEIPTGAEPSTPPTPQTPPPGLPLPEPDVPGGEPEIERLRRLGTGSRETIPPTPEEIEGAAQRKAWSEAEARVEKWMKGRAKEKPEGRPEAPPEVKKAAEGEHGKGKLAEQAKARERITKNRAVAKRTQEAKATEATARAQAKGMDVSQLQIPEMEEFVRSKRPTEWSGLQKLRKAKSITDLEYTEALKYYVLDEFEKQ